MDGTIIITGANGGLGSSIVSRILQSPEYSGLHGIYTVRDTSTATTLQAILGEQTGEEDNHEILGLDLSQLADVRRFAAGINARVANGLLPPIRALALNAGFQEHSTQTMSKDGLDMTFQVNYLAHFLLTTLLLQSMDKDKGRILVIGSWLHDPEHPRINGATIFPQEYRPILAGGVEPLATGRWGGHDALAGRRRYGASKLCQILMILELQRRLDRDPIFNSVSVLGLDPGGMPSGIMRRASFLESTIINYLAGNALAPIMTWLWPNGQLRTTTKSAADVLRALFDEETLGPHPKAIYLNGSEPCDVSPDARNPENGQMLWRESLVLAGIVAGDTELAEWN